MTWFDSVWCGYTQALYFKEQDIDQYRDCFYLMTKTNGGLITRVDELKHIMRSLGMSPTEPELNDFFKQKGSDFRK